MGLASFCSKVLDSAPTELAALGLLLRPSKEEPTALIPIAITEPTTAAAKPVRPIAAAIVDPAHASPIATTRSEEHTSELQSH